MKFILLMICIICGLTFESNRAWQKCCSKDCSKINNKEYDKEYQKENKEEIKEYHKEYQQTPKGKEVDKKTQAKRRRNLGFNPLNVWFENSEGHHINKEDVIYIPKDWHFKGGHSVTRNRNMEPINTVSFFFLTMQNIDRLIERYL